MVHDVLVHAAQHAATIGKRFARARGGSSQGKNLSHVLGVTTVDNVLIRMDKHIVHVHRIIVVDVANFDTIDTIMSISTIHRTTTVENNKLTFHSRNQRQTFLFFPYILNIERKRIKTFFFHHRLKNLVVDISSSN